MSSVLQPIDEKILRDYLLERLPADDFEAIDLRIIEDEVFAEQLSFAENDLIEDYLDDMLAKDEIQAFQNSFLITPERKRMLIEISDLRALARLENDAVPASAVQSKDEMVEKRSWFRPLVLIPAFGVLLLGMLLAWQLLKPVSLSPLEQEFAAKNKNELTDVSAFGPNSTVNLTGGALRDGSGVPRRSLSELADPMLFRIALPNGQDVSKGFGAEIYLGNRKVFTQSELPVHQNQSGQELRILVPKSILSVGQHQIRVENKASKTTTNYTFIIN